MKKQAEEWLKKLVEAAKDPKKRRALIAFVSIIGVSLMFRKTATAAGKIRNSSNAASEATKNEIKKKIVEKIVRKRLPFSEFLQKVEKGQIGKVFLDYDLIEFSVKDAVKDQATKNISDTGNVVYYTNPISMHPGLVELLHQKEIPFDELASKGILSTTTTTGTTSSPLRSIMMVLIPVAYLSVCAYVIKKMYDQTSGGDVGMLSDKNKSSSGPAVKKTGFDDVAGIGAAREVVEEVADFLKNPERYTRVGARLPTGILLIGPPGTGKTMLARAMANESGLPFFHCSGSDFVEIYAGRGASRVRNLFKKAAKAAPCVVFVDEIDALGKSRSADFSMNEEREQTLNQLLAAMDGFSSEKRVVIMAATNRYDVLDKALVRPGRFDRIVRVTLPDQAGREAILKVHTRHMNLSGDCDLSLVASLSPDYTGAELSMIVNEAAIRAARDKRDCLLTDDFLIALRIHKDSTQRGSSSLNRSGSDIMGQLFGNGNGMN